MDHVLKGDCISTTGSRYDYSTSIGPIVAPLRPKYISSAYIDHLGQYSGRTPAPGHEAPAEARIPRESQKNSDAN